MDKLSQNQAMMADQFKQMQDTFKLETASLKARAADIEA